MQVWNMLQAARWKYRTQKSRQKSPSGTIAQLCRAISSQLRHVSTIGKKLLSSNMSSRCPHNMVNFGPLTAEIRWRIWGTPANFNGFPVLAALLLGSQVMIVNQTLRRWTAPPILGRATITLGIGPRSRFFFSAACKLTINYMQQTVGLYQDRIASYSILPCVTRMFDDNQVCHSVTVSVSRCVKNVSRSSSSL